MAIRAASGSQLELSFNPPERSGDQQGLKEPPQGAHQDQAAQAVNPADRTHITLTAYKPNSRDKVFRRRLKQERGGKCERCGRKASSEKLCVHHILETRAFPQFAREKRNALVLCERCHASVSQGESFGTSMLALFYAQLPSDIRARHLPFLQAQLDPSSALVSAFKHGNSDYWNSKTVRDLTR
jgi:hypothetical protein